MSSNPKLEVVPSDDGPTTIAKPDEFNLDKFKSTRAATMANVETLLNGLPSCASSMCQPGAPRRM